MKPHLVHLDDKTSVEIGPECRLIIETDHMGRVSRLAMTDLSGEAVGIIIHQVCDVSAGDVARAQKEPADYILQTFVVSDDPI